MRTYGLSKLEKSTTNGELILNPTGKETYEINSSMDKTI